MNRASFSRTAGCLLTVVVALVPLAACGGQGGDGGDAGFQPTRDVVMIVPFAPGGGSDILGRAMASGIEQVTDGEVNVTVENRPAGSGAAGYSYLLQQSGDPHFLLASETTGVALPLAVDVPFHWSDFTPIAQIAEDATLMVVNQDAPWQSLPEVIDAAKQGQITVGVTGATSLDTIVTSLVEEDQNVKFDPVVFESGGELVTALLADDIDMATLNPGEVAGQLESGKMRALAVFAEQPYETGDLADLPTAPDEGVDVTFTQYRGPFAPGDIPEDARKFWEDTIREWTETDAYDKYIEENTLRPVYREGQEFEEYLKEYEKTVDPVFN